MKINLSGPEAFYNQPNYIERTKKELEDKSFLQKLRPFQKSDYTYRSENRVVSTMKQIVSIVFFPMAIYKGLHARLGHLVLPASMPLLGRNRWLSNRIGTLGKPLNEKRATQLKDDEWKMKRVSIKVDGQLIDAMIYGKKSTLSNGRWVLPSPGNGEAYEDYLQSDSFQQILTQFEGNALLFNYPGVADSTGLPSRRALKATHLAMLKFLEDQEKGLGAKEIIGYGHSLGGGIQADAIKSHKMKDNVKYVFVKSRTFSQLSKVVEDMASKMVSNLGGQEMGDPLFLSLDSQRKQGRTSKLIGHLLSGAAGKFTKKMGWNINTAESSEKLQVPEVILQTGCLGDEGEGPSFLNDGVIAAKASLGQALYNGKGPIPNKVCMPIRELHNWCLFNDTIEDLTEVVKGFLNK